MQNDHSHIAMPILLLNLMRKARYIVKRHIPLPLFILLNKTFYIFMIFIFLFIVEYFFVGQFVYRSGFIVLEGALNGRISLPTILVNMRHLEYFVGKLARLGNKGALVES